jgi:hypothetical protein
VNLDQAIATLRSRLDDEVTPYLWPQADLISYLNARRNEFARRTLYFRDSSTAAICTITAVVGTGDYALDERIITVDRVKGSWSNKPLPKKTLNFMDTYLMGWEAADNGEPIDYLIDKTIGYLTVYPKPSTAGTFALTVSRLPLTQFAVTDIGKTTPVSLDFPLLWQENLLDGVLASAFGKPDSQTRNPQKEKDYLGKWEMHILDVMMDMTRDRSVDTNNDPLPDYYSIHRT